MNSQINPYLLGAALALVGMIILFSVLYYHPTLEDYFLGQKKVWVQFAAYSFTLFGWLVTSLRPRHSTLEFWSFVACVLTIHTLGLAAFIHYVRPLGPIHYILCGPFEGLAIAWLWQQGKVPLRRVHRG